MEKIKVALVDDHHLVRDGIQALLEDVDRIQVVAEGKDGQEALELVRNLEFDLLILDINMPGMSGLEVMKKLSKIRKRPYVLMLSMHDSKEYVIQSVKYGAEGYLLKGATKEEFLRAIYTIAEGNKYFTGELSSIILNNLMNKKDYQLSAIKVEDQFQLTKREKQILELIMDGLTNQDIADELNISRRTAEVHRFNLMKKMDVNNLIDLSNKVKEYLL